MNNLIKHVHPEWDKIFTDAITKLSPQYVDYLQTSDQWLPGIQSLFAAFTYPVSSIRYILLGESPYPRAESANGYAFWDNSVGSLWSETGLSKPVNRATSLRNLIKMLLVARGDLVHDLSQNAIARLDKSKLIQTAAELFSQLMSHGFLLLNASLVYSEGQVNEHARQWRPFILALLEGLAIQKPSLQLVLLGRIADMIPKTTLPVGLRAEHPYNLSFITNPNVVQFFKPMDLLNHE